MMNTKKQQKKKLAPLTKEAVLKNFNQNGIGMKNQGIFGLPFHGRNASLADMQIIHVPWDVTVSSGAGTEQNFEAIFEASLQVDLFEESNRNFWKDGIAIAQLPNMRCGNSVDEESEELRYEAEEYLSDLSQGIKSYYSNHEMSLENINKGGEELNALVKRTAKKLLDQNKMVAVLGGDHSTPLGLIQALAEKHPEGFSILHIDAHADLREAYEGFEFSHASIMYNALKIPQVEKILQVGIRDYCEEEALCSEFESERVEVSPWAFLTREMMSGKSWNSLCQSIAKSLGSKVYISFDIDGLDPSLCPHTGTPVPGGLSYDQAVHLLESVVRAGKEIIGFDLVEIGNDSWDANVGARLLYKLCSLMHESQKRK